MRRAAARVYAAQGFVGLPDSAPKPRATLASMFVPLVFRPEREHREDGVDLPLSELESSWLRPAKAGEVAARVAILGDPGSGKSTLCRYLAVTAAQRDRGLIPLLLSVRSWAAEGAREGLLEMAAREVSSTLSVRVDEGTLEAACVAGGVVLLVDGVDEVGPVLREKLRDRVTSFAEVYPRVPVIVTSRIVGYDEAPLDRGVFRHLRLEPFRDDQLQEFIERWYEIAEPDNPVERRRRRAALRAALDAEPRARELARNPLLATLIALVHFHQAQLPGDRARLYQLCIELLVVTWPAACGRKLDALDGNWQIARLEELALWMQRQRTGKERSEQEILIGGAELDRQLDALLAKHRDDLDDGHRRSLALEWRSWLISASGLLQEQQSGRYGFVHLSLMEYLAGRGVIRELGSEGDDAIAQFVMDHYGEAVWRESLLLMLGSEGDKRELTMKVVERLLEQPDWERCVFAISMLREEVELSQGLGRARVFR